MISIALAIAIGAARIETQITRSEEARFVARQAALDGLDYAAWRIAAEDAGQLDNLSAYAFSINGYEVRFKPSIESEKLDINLASEATLSSFFHALGMDADEAGKFAARIADWRDEDDLARPNGAEARDYATAKSGEKIGNRMFYSTDELKLVLIAPQDLINCAMPALTIFGDGSPPSTLLMQSLFARNLERGEASSSARLGTASRSAAAGRRYAITASAVTIESAARPYKLTGIFRITGQREQPFDWIAQFEPPQTTAVMARECSLG